MIVVTSIVSGKIYGAYENMEKAVEGMRYLPGWLQAELKYNKVETEYNGDYHGPESFHKEADEEMEKWTENF